MRKIYGPDPEEMKRQKLTPGLNGNTRYIHTFALSGLIYSNNLRENDYLYFQILSEIVKEKGLAR